MNNNDENEPWFSEPTHQPCGLEKKLTRVTVKFFEWVCEKVANYFSSKNKEENKR
jgi:hypothetical protein